MQVNYWPSKVEKTAEDAQPKYAKTHVSKEQISGERVKEDLFVGDDYKQAGDRIRGMDPQRWIFSIPGPLSIPIYCCMGMQAAMQYLS